MRPQGLAQDNSHFLNIYYPPGGDQKLLINIILDNKDKVYILDEPIFNVHPDHWKKDIHFIVHLMGWEHDWRYNFMKKILMEHPVIKEPTDD